MQKLFSSIFLLALFAQFASAGVRIGAGGSFEPWDRHTALHSLNQNYREREWIRTETVQNAWARQVEVDDVLRYVDSEVLTKSDPPNNRYLTSHCDYWTSIFESHFLALALGLHTRDLESFWKIWGVCFGQNLPRVPDDALVLRFQNLFVALDLVAENLTRLTRPDQITTATNMALILPRAWQQVDSQPFSSEVKTWFNHQTSAIGHQLQLAAAGNPDLKLPPVFHQIMDVSGAQMTIFCRQLLENSRREPSPESTRGRIRGGPNN